MLTLKYSQKLKRLPIYTCAIILLFSCGVRPVVNTQPTDNGTARWAYTEAIKQATIWDNTAAAIKWHNIAIERDSNYDAAWFELSKLEFNSEKAYHYAQKAVELDSTNLAYRSQLGWQMVINGDEDEALRFFNKLLLDDPHNYMNYRVLAALYSYKELPFSAISVLDSAEVKLGATDDLVRYRLRLLTEVRLFDRATRDAEQILAEDPNDVDALIIMAEQAERNGNEREYLRYVRRLFEQSEYPFANKRSVFERLTADIEFYRRNYFDLHTLATTLRREYPDSYEALDLYAKHLIYTGEIGDALQTYKSFLDNPNAKLETFQMIIDIEGYLQSPDSVSKYAAMAIAKYPQNALLYASRGGALLTMGKNTEAVKEFEKAVKYADSDSLKSAMLGILGDVYYEANLVQKSLSTYRKALRLDKNNASVLNNYAYYLCIEEDADKKLLEKCLEMSRRANEISPSNPSFLDTQGWILYLLGRNEEAKQLMLHALALDKTRSATLYYHYADILEALGDTFMAETYRKRAKESEK